MVPWLERLGLGRTSTEVDLVLLQYDARFLAGWNPELAPKEPGIARADVLARYASVAQQTERRERARFAGAHTLVLPLDEAARSAARTSLSCVGFEVQEPEWSADRPPTPQSLMRPLVCSGPRFRVLHPPQENSRIALGFELALTRVVERALMRLGKAELTIAGSFARLSIDR